MTEPLTPAAPAPLSGRRAEAARNDERILQSARAVFLADPGAPISAVAKHAGVGISALYSRYGSKEELLRKLCHDGLALFVEITEEALRDERDAWAMFSDYMRRGVDADTNSLTLALAGKFTPTPDMFELGERANALGVELFERIKPVVREGVRAPRPVARVRARGRIKIADPERTADLRRRYLQIILDGLRATDRGPLTRPAPSWQEINERWVT